MIVVNVTTSNPSQIITPFVTTQDAPTTMAETVVILGAGYAGIGIAHMLLKHTRPKVKELTVVLVSPTTHHYWNMAAVRGIIPGEFADEQLFKAIEPGFENYPQNSFKFVLGAATGIDITTNSVCVKTANDITTLGYTQLIIATGSSYPGGLPFTIVGTYEASTSALHSLQEEVKTAKSIVIAGGGPTGVETAGELAQTFGDSKQITLITSGDKPLPSLRSDVGNSAAVELEKLKVKIIPGVHVTSTNTTDHQASVTLSDGQTLLADLYLPLYGMRPNSQFIPSQLLDSRGNLKLDKNLRVTGVDNVWGVGDVGDLEPKQLIYAERQAIHLGKNLDAVLVGRQEDVKDLKPTVTPQVFVTIGKKTGTGQYNWVRIPGFVVSAAKGRTFFSDKGSGLIAGKNIVRSSI